VTYDDRIAIPTPEGIELELVLAGVGSRMVASLLDLLIKAAVLVALWIIAGAVSNDGGGGFVEAAAIVGAFVLWFGYDVAFETLGSGRTPGKRAAGLRVVRLGGEPVGFMASAVRNLLRLVDMQPGVIYALGATAVLFSRRNQRLGDMAAGTLVVRERRAPLPLTRPAGPDFAVADRYAGWDVSGVTSFELVTVRRFLERRWQLDPGARNRLGWELAERLRPKVAGAPSGLHPEQFLEALAEAKASRG
jgi:uncharacterized RDD family membrane protein YckC